MATEMPWRTWRLKPRALGGFCRLAFTLVAVALAVHWAQQALPRYLPKDWDKAHEYDTLQDWLAARVYAHGGSPYSSRGLRELRTGIVGHPPTSSFFFIPLARFEKPVAAELISLSTWVLLGALLYICSKEVRFPSPLALTALLFGWALTTAGLVIHWHAIQSSVQIAFAMTLCWAYLRRGRQWQAGAALGAAATFKLFPGLLFLYLLFARRWRAFAMATAVYGGVAIFMSLTYGFDSWRIFLTQQGPNAEAWVGSIRNASLYGVIVRLLQPICVDGPHAKDHKAAFITLALALFLLLLSTILSARATRHARQVDPRSIDLPFALFTVLAVFLNPWSWEHYWVLLIQPAFVVSTRLFEHFRRALTAWLDESESTRAFARATASFAVGALGIASVAKLVNVQNIHADSFLGLWRLTKTEWVHHQLHLYEVFNWLPWPVMIVLCAFALLATRREYE